MKLGSGSVHYHVNACFSPLAACRACTGYSMQGQEQACRLLDLPSELQLKILSLTPEYGPLWHNDTVPLTRCLPFTTYDDDRNEDPLQVM